MHLKLNENTGKRARCTAGLFTNSEATLSQSVVVEATDKGCAPRFKNVTTDNIKMLRVPGFDLETKQMTVSAWAKFASVSNYRYIVSDYNAAATQAQYALQLTNTNRMTFFWANTGTQYPNPFTAAGTTSIVAGKWYHVCGVRSGATGNWTAKIYVNGVRENSTNTVGAPARISNVSTSIAIGAAGDYPSGLTMEGHIMNVMIYERALTDSEILDLYRNQYNLVNNWGK